MRFLADQCVFGKTARALRGAGHEVETLRALGKQAAEDEEVLGTAVALDAVLVTNDLHFSNILVYPPGRHEGVVVLRISHRTQNRVHDILLNFLKATGREALRGATIIVNGKTYRIRRGGG